MDGDGAGVHGLIAKYGLFAIYLGATFEGDASVMAGGVFYHKGFFDFWPLVIVCALGAWTSDLTIYSLGRLATNSHWVRTRSESLARHPLIGALVSRPLILSLAFRFIPGARTIGPVALATAGDVRPLHYIAITAIAGFTWSILLVTSGQVIGHLLEAILGELRPHIHIIIWTAAVIVSLILAAVLHRRYFS